MPSQTPRSLHPLPEVLDTPENASGGILVVAMPGLGPETAPLRRGNFFDNSIDRGEVIERFIGWFSLWGVDLERVRGREGPFERQFFTCEWPQTPPAGHGPQMVPNIAKEVGALAQVLQKRRPRLVIFLSRYLWLAANTPEARAVLDPVIGAPVDEGRRISSARLNAHVQRWEKCLVLSLPQPSKNTTTAFVLSVAAGVRRALAACGSLPAARAADPLLPQAGGCLVIDKEKSIRSIAARLHVERERAAALFDSLENKAWIRNNGVLLAKTVEAQDASGSLRTKQQKSRTTSKSTR